MKFKNETANTLNFSVREFPFQVEPGSICDIPDTFAYIVAKRGLPLTPIGSLPVMTARTKKKSKREVTVGEGPKGQTIEFSEELSQIPLDSEK